MAAKNHPGVVVPQRTEGDDKKHKTRDARDNCKGTIKIDSAAKRRDLAIEPSGREKGQRRIQRQQINGTFSSGNGEEHEHDEEPDL